MTTDDINSHAQQHRHQQDAQENELQHDHDHEHDHGHGHVHVHAPKDFGKAFLIGVLLNTSFVVAEVVYGILGHSLALVADAGHNLSDVLGLLLAWGASILVKKAPTMRFTYGLRSSSILAALINAALLLLVTGGIAWEAILRFQHPDNVESRTVIVVAAIGVAINLATAFLFMAGRKGDLNVRAAFTHMMGDAAIALGVVAAGFAIMYTGWHWLDPLTSLVISLVVIVGTWGLLTDSINLALHAVPEGIDTVEVQAYLASIDGVTDVHDLHIWGMSTTETALTAHLVFPLGYPGDGKRNEIAFELRKRFSIQHATMQFETGDVNHPCELAPSHVV
ncbi:cation diffusion facilitator family transporter [Noviherbaspirillum pedocola]|uniref:Cation transporter n=1 Tax=Noviherbaspirillum pedocola TaxID=2801341 RepID=A0A934SXS3_9BURK|nr:cation diffusion facilitator family transporter [Noviherbaspirillum pedocola]MBK4734654.1 cation transporter [Noviherbaspirillum pedocola]